MVVFRGVRINPYSDRIRLPIFTQWFEQKITMLFYKISPVNRFGWFSPKLSFLFEKNNSIINFVLKIGLKPIKISLIHN